MTLCTNNYSITRSIHKHLPAALPPFFIFERESNWGGSGMIQTLILKNERSLRGLGLFLNCLTAIILDDQALMSLPQILK